MTTAPARSPWLIVAAGLALIGAAVVLYAVLPLGGVSIAVISGVAVVAFLTHLGLIATLAASVYALFRRRRNH